MTKQELDFIFEHEGNYLVTTDNWFIAPNGKQYRSVWGKVVLVNDTVLGIKTNAKSTNWYAVIGDGDSKIIIAGCQVHYAIECHESPNLGAVTEVHYHDHKAIENNRDSYIYNANKID